MCRLSSEQNRQDLAYLKLTFLHDEGVMGEGRQIIE